MLPRLIVCLLLVACSCGVSYGEATSPAKSAASKTPAASSSAASRNAASNDFSKYDALIVAITIFVLACFVGYEVIGKVPTTLHTPLMSGSNAISGITVVGAIIVASYGLSEFSSFLGFGAIVLAMINVVGGFLVTHRMLAMFKRK